MHATSTSPIKRRVKISTCASGRQRTVRLSKWMAWVPPVILLGRSRNRRTMFVLHPVSLHRVKVCSFFRPCAVVVPPLLYRQPAKPWLGLSLPWLDASVPDRSYSRECERGYADRCLRTSVPVSKCVRLLTIAVFPTVCCFLGRVPGRAPTVNCTVSLSVAEEAPRRFCILESSLGVRGAVSRVGVLSA